MKRLRIKVIGDVQGVFYRFSAKIVADDAGITGWAQNEPDGSVSMVIEGKDEVLEKFTQWAEEGSPMAAVEKVLVSEEEYTGEFKKFEVK
ncbi:MAG: acylphosphatase [bacterium]|nr:acylphosphatase [bacterium]